MSDELLATLDIWDMQLVRFGSSIIDGRIKFVEELNDIISSIHSNLTGGKESLSVKYEPYTTVEGFENMVQSSRDKDIRYKTTGTGCTCADKKTCKNMLAYGYQVFRICS